MAVRIKKADWNFYKKLPGRTKEENGKKYVLFANGGEDNTPGFREVETMSRKEITAKHFCDYQCELKNTCPSPEDEHCSQLKKLGLK